MNFYVAMKDLGIMTSDEAITQCSNYVFCENIKGTLPDVGKLKSIYNNKSQINNLLSTNAGTPMTEDWYWSSTNYYGSPEKDAVSMVHGETDVNTTGNFYVRPVLTSW